MAVVVSSASVLGFNPFTKPQPGLDTTCLRPDFIKVAGLDIEVEVFEGGGFPLYTNRILSIAIVYNWKPGVFIYTLGSTIENDDNNSVFQYLRVSSSMSCVAEALSFLYSDSPDFLCIHNGFKFDIPCMVVHSPLHFKHMFNRVPLGAIAQGHSLDIPGCTVLDTYFYLDKLHRSDYSSLSLAALAEATGLSPKLSAPLMSVETMSTIEGVISMAEYNVRDAYLHYKVAEATGCISQGYMINWEPWPVPDNWKYRGAQVMEPVKGVHNDVYVFDIASMYPSIMEAASI
jgi:DNA polymerase elongation subunit (family B)